MITEADCGYLRVLPLMDTVTLGTVRFTVVHAAPSDPLYHYLPPGTPNEAWGAELSLVDTDVHLLGHTHLPLLYPHMHPLVVNPGSVGLPRDGGQRAEYAVWEDRVVTFHRRAYDKTSVVEAIARLPLLPHTIENLVALFEGRWRPVL